MSPLIDPEIIPHVESLYPGEEIDFAIKTKRKLPFILGIIKLIIALTVFALVLSIIGGFFMPLTDGKEHVMIINGISTRVDINWLLQHETFVIVMLAIFFIGSIIAMIDALRTLFWDPAWYVGTNKHLVMLSNKEMVAGLWNKFNNNVVKVGVGQKCTVVVNPNPAETNIGSIVMNGIPNADQIVELCKQRISEHAELTPAPG